MNLSKIYLKHTWCAPKNSNYQLYRLNKNMVLGNKFKINLQNVGWFMILVDNQVFHPQSHRQRWPDSFENKMWKLICVKLASWHFIKTPSKTNIPQCQFWKMPLNQWHDLERYPAAKTILKTLLPQDHKLPWSLWQLLSSMPWKTPLYLFSSMSFFPPTSPINNLLSTWAKLKNSKYLAYLA